MKLEELWETRGKQSVRMNIHFCAHMHIDILAMQYTRTFSILKIISYFWEKKQLIKNEYIHIYLYIY